MLMLTIHVVKASSGGIINTRCRYFPKHASFAVVYASLFVVEITQFCCFPTAFFTKYGLHGCLLVVFRPGNGHICPLVRHPGISGRISTQTLETHGRVQQPGTILVTCLLSGVPAFTTL